MKRAFLYGWVNFPRGGANANYLEYLSLSLKDCGYEEVVVVSNLSSDAALPPEGGMYRGIRVLPVAARRGRIRHYVDFNFRRGAIYADRIAACRPGPDDLLVSYCLDASELWPVLRLSRKTGARTAACIPEYYPPEAFARGRLNYRYFFCVLARKLLIPRSDYLLPVSEYIRKKYPRGDCLTLPPLCDVREFPFRARSGAGDGKIRLIYATGGWVKDSLETMLSAVAQIFEEKGDCLEFHITGVSPALLSACRNPLPGEWMGARVVAHKWLSYPELVDLYARMDFMLLMREDNPLCRANFPSRIPEALCHGVIPIASKVGDYTALYLADGENSLLFSGSGAADCAAAIRRALSLDVKSRARLRAAARRCAEEQFDYRNWTPRLRALLAPQGGRRAEEGWQP